MKFIELTEPSTGNPITVNLDHISKINYAGRAQILLQTGEYFFVDESYEEVLRRIAEVNDKQFCFVRRPEKPETDHCNEKPYHEQKIVSAEAIYTGGGIWNYMGELEGGKFFMAFDDDYYGFLILDADPRKAGEDGEEAYYPYWQEAHTLWEYNEGNETEETLGMIRRLYNFLKTKDFADKESHITALDNHEYRLRMEGKL